MTLDQIENLQMMFALGMTVATYVFFKMVGKFFRID